MYTGLELQVTKETSRLQIIGSYTRAVAAPGRHLAAQRSRRRSSSRRRSPTTRASARPARSTTNGLSGTDLSDNLNWRDHVVRTGVTYSAPWQLILGTSYALQSGQYSGPVVTRLAAADPGSVRPPFTLSNGRVVSNPLATTIRYAFPTRGEGQLRTPAVHLFNIRVGRSFDLGAQRRLELSLDVLNVPNAGGGPVIPERSEPAVQRACTAG